MLTSRSRKVGDVQQRERAALVSHRGVGLEVWTNADKPEEAAQARSYPGAVSASVRVEPAEDGRTELRLVMTFEGGRAPDPAEIRRWVRGRVLPHKVPRYIEVSS